MPMQSGDVTNECLWSILIPTIEERKRAFQILFLNLTDQITKAGLQGIVCVEYLSDNREMSVGKKRNELKKNARGKYISYVDDDDKVSDEYISAHYELIKDEKPDCIGLIGVLSDSRTPVKRKFVHSIIHSSYFEANGIYYRPPNHLNVIRKSIAVLFDFPNKNHGEDSDWAMNICRAKAIKTERRIDKPMYFYNFNPSRSATVGR